MAESKTAGEGSSDNHEDWPEVELTWGTQMKKKKKMEREWPEANPVQRNDGKNILLGLEYVQIYYS